jgi:hypothetical protein
MRADKLLISAKTAVCGNVPRMPGTRPGMTISSDSITCVMAGHVPAIHALAEFRCLLDAARFSAPCYGRAKATSESPSLVPSLP